ncbi:hypothetical protein WJX75_002168 [Coccomyxa subellipsoidea]|uniref:Glutathione peroxidase n=1 Tax=Coccomyxa subellipsoidea TaxID=248742 RepID=A0ABR2YPL5_9CHLO
MRRTSPLLPLHPPSGRRKRQDLQTNLKRTLLLAGLATALIFGGLSLRKLTDARADKTFKAVEKEDSQVPLYLMTAEDIDGKEQSMSQYSGKVLLITNVASQCGFTDSNYKGLQKLYEKFQGRGFEVLAFPCNQFGNQEPGDSQTIKEFAQKKYQVTFPLFKKVEALSPGKATAAQR